MTSNESQGNQELTIALTPKQLGLIAAVIILVIGVRRCCKAS